MDGSHARLTTSRIKPVRMGWLTATHGRPRGVHVAHMGDETIHTEGERFDIREANGKLYVYDKEEDVKLAYLVQT